MPAKNPPPEAAADIAVPEGAPAPTTAAPQPPGPGVYEYVGSDERTYLWPGFPPQTAAKGDVCTLPVAPDDERWVPSSKDVNRLPDNHPDAPAMAEARRLAAAAGQAPVSAESPAGGEQS